jgi:hypothetical protein
MDWIGWNALWIREEQVANGRGERSRESKAHSNALINFLLSLFLFPVSFRFVLFLKRILSNSDDILSVFHRLLMVKLLFIKVEMRSRRHFKIAARADLLCVRLIVKFFEWKRENNRNNEEEDDLGRWR